MSWWDSSDQWSLARKIARLFLFERVRYSNVQKYYAEIDKIIRYGGSRNESSLRKQFQDWLEGYARAKNLVLVAEVELESKRGTRIRPDGVLKDALRQDWEFWESKDEKDNIEAEIKARFNKGYP